MLTRPLTHGLQLVLLQTSVCWFTNVTLSRGRCLQGLLLRSGAACLQVPVLLCVLEAAWISGRAVPSEISPPACLSGGSPSFMFFCVKWRQSVLKVYNFCEEPDRKYFGFYRSRVKSLGKHKELPTNKKKKHTHTHKETSSSDFLERDSKCNPTIFCNTSILMKGMDTCFA